MGNARKPEQRATNRAIGMLAVLAGMVAAAGTGQGASCPTGPDAPGRGVILSTQERQAPSPKAGVETAVFAMG